jgi:hypothetical protein
MRSVTIPHFHPRAAIPLALPLPLAAAAIACLDLWACGIYWSFLGVSLEAVARAPAAWVVGADSARALAGWGALLGMGVLYATAVVEIATYRWLVRHLDAVARHPLRWALPYGALAFALLNWVVIPLSAAPEQQARGEWLAALLLIHVLAIGPLCALLGRVPVLPRPLLASGRWHRG